MGSVKSIKAHLSTNIAGYASLIVILGVILNAGKHLNKIETNSETLQSLKNLPVQVAEISQSVNSNHRSLENLHSVSTDIALLQQKMDALGTVSKDIAVVQEKVDGLSRQVNSILDRRGFSSFIFIDCAHQKGYVRHASPDWSVTNKGNEILIAVPELMEKINILLGQMTPEHFTFDSVLYQLYQQFPNQGLLQLSLETEATLEELLGTALVYVQEQSRKRN